MSEGMSSGFLDTISFLPWMTAAALVAMLAIPWQDSHADDGVNYQRLQQRVEQLETEIQQMRTARSASSTPVRIPPVRAGEDLSWEDLDGATCRADAGKSAYPTIQLGGFFQVDAGWFYQDANNVATVGDIQDGADFRRARLNAHGDAWDNIGYMMEFDFAFPGRPNFMDVYVDIRQLPVLGNLRIGQWRQPFGMDGQTSVKDLTFLERGLPFAFLPFRQVGIGFFDHSRDERITWAVSAFRFPTDAFGGNVGDSGGYALASRITILPIDSEDGAHLLHLGAAYSFGDPSNNRVRYRNQPEFFVSETGGADLVPAGVPSSVPPFVDTGPIFTNNFNLFAAEGGLTWGSFYMQSEAIAAVVNQQAGPDLAFSGAYAYAGYFLTGEVRPYNRTAGVFGRVKPLNHFGSDGGIGAWEVAARWSYIDLNDENIRGGRLNDITFGLNWYLNPRTKFQFNYIHAFLDNATTGDSEANVFALRGQIDF